MIDNSKEGHIRITVTRTTGQGEVFRPRAAYEETTVTGDRIHRVRQVFEADSITTPAEEIHIKAGGLASNDIAPLFESIDKLFQGNQPSVTLGPSNNSRKLLP